MDTGAYPSDAVKKFLEPMVLMKLSTETTKEGARLAKLFELTSWPTILILLPSGEVLRRLGAMEVPDQFLAGCISEYWNAWMAAEGAAPQDKKKIAENMFLLATWFPQTDQGKHATGERKRYEADPEWKARWDELAKETERRNLWAKADARVKLKRKKEEISEPLKALVENHAGSKEAGDAAALAKKLGLKLDAPAGGPKK